MHTRTFPKLTTSRLVLRQFRESDLEDVYRGLSHPDVTRYYGIRFHSLEATREQLAWFASLEKEGTGIWWAICRQTDGTFIGAGGFNNLDTTHLKAEVGFWLLPEYWGQGFMQEAMPVILQHGFEVLELHRVEGFVESENVSCKRAIEQLGFACEGTMRECEIKDGKFIDLDIYAVLGN